MEGVARREVLRRDDPFGIPACFYWTIDEVADWVDSIGYGKYKENFRSHFVNGRKLLTIDACVLPKMGITHFGDILALAKQIRDQIRVRNDRKEVELHRRRRESVSLNQASGKLHLHCSYMHHLQLSEPIIAARLTFFRKRSIYYSGWSMEGWWDEKLRAEEHSIREKQKLLADEEDKMSATGSKQRKKSVAGSSQEKRFVIGNTQQERLREAAGREVSNQEWAPHWPRPLIAKMVRCPQNMPLPCPCQMQPVSKKVIGHLNMTPVTFKCGQKHVLKVRGDSDGHLLTDQSGQTKETPKTPQVTVETSKTAETSKIAETSKTAETPEIAQTSTTTETSTAAAIAQAAPRLKPYLPIMMHWKRMDNTRGYPQLKVTAIKCGYYSG